MAKKKKARAEPQQRNQSGMAWLCSTGGYDSLCCEGYTRLSDNPEIVSAINKIADLISSMSIHLMGNSKNGDVRIKNELSRKVDINPNKYMTRKTFISVITRILLLEGDGNCVVYPQSQGGMIGDLIPLQPQHAAFLSDGFGYKILYDGKEYATDELLHFVINPGTDYPWKGTGYRVALKDIAKNLKQASKTQKGFMESKWKPSIIVKVDGLNDEFSNKAGRKKLLEQYIESSEAGEPWMIPAEQFDIQEVRPLSLNDLALSDAVTLDKRTVAAILDVPPFVVGVGEYKREEWNNFINTRIRLICNAIEMELTRKLLIQPDWYFRFNVRSLYAYDIDTLSTVGANMYTRGIMTGNEVRDWINLPPKEGLDELIILENYIPQGMIGDQKKLLQGGDGENGEN
ncbi:MAG: phage portal protein [Clostridiales Family XIII bacterium]|uniref:phage portal protein n=1 Tax=Hominibacterium faecale TaxID=2839743 RepID=UPI0022B2A3FA|nr:phage portal protein [Hominibacterium faecale]MCI7301842.1 phage portal protein [Clostridia bacterium]MDY3010319.1 phage portal protein [Clostridiales Family XIII bacterium]